jgi:oligopeptide transport system substrate-binding protein
MSCLVAEPPSLAAAQETRSGQAASEPAGVYRRPLGHDPATLDPARLSDIYGQSVAHQLFDGLVQYDRTLAIAPALAQFWKASRDGLTWTFTLRKGVKFHHGREMTADDVVYSLARLLDPKVKSGAADLFGSIKGAQEFREGKAQTVSGLVALDSHTVQVTLKEALAPFVSVLAIGHTKILPRDVVEERGEAFGMHPVGTGPFKFIRWDRQKEIVLGANPDYFNEPPKLSRLVYRIFPGEQLDAAYQEFLRGHLEDTPIPPQKYQQIVNAPTHIYVKRPMISVRFYGFNTRTPPLNDQRVRQALIHAVDRQTLIEEVFLGRYALARGILPPGTLGFNPELKGYAFDPAKARALLAQAGYPSGKGLPPIVFWSSVKTDRIVREHELMKRQLETVGFRAEFQYLPDWPSFSKMLEEGRLPAFLYAWYADVPDPDNFLFELFHSRSRRNLCGYANPAVDDLLLQARSTADLRRRVELYRKAEQLVINDAPILPAWHYTYERLFQPYVRNIEVSGLGDPYIPFRKVWLERPR